MPLLSRLTAPVVVAGAATVALLGLAVTSADTTTVTLSVDGEPREVTTEGDRVSDALAAAGLVVGEHDVLVPAMDTVLEDGDAVALRRARELTLVVDGVERTVWVTAESVDEALDQIGFAADGHLLSASRSRSIGLEGLELSIRTPRAILVHHDGVSTPLTTTARTVAGAIAEAGVLVGPADTVTVPMTAEVVDRMAIQVVRGGSETVVERIALPAGEQRRDDPSLDRGTTRVLDEGADGVLVRTTTYVLADGARTTSTVSEVRESEPRPKVVAVGTRTPPPPPPPAARASTNDGLDWAALARCESGGNPRAISPNGMYHGLYQFSVSTWRGVGGSGLPSEASPDEQTSRAQMLYARTGPSSWPTCGRYL